MGFGAVGLLVVGIEIGLIIGMILFTWLGERRGKSDRDEEVVAALLTKGKITIKARVARDYSVTLTQIPEVNEETDK